MSLPVTNLLIVHRIPLPVRFSSRTHQYSFEGISAWSSASELRKKMVATTPDVTAKRIICYR